ncbi:hypothetical protein A0E43_19535 [Pectobacterium cacticida]
MFEELAFVLPETRSAAGNATEPGLEPLFTIKTISTPKIITIILGQNLLFKILHNRSFVNKINADNKLEQSIR